MKKEIEIPETKYLSKTDLFLILAVAFSVKREEKKLLQILHRAKKEKIPGHKIYEALLQTYLFAGFPTALISLRILSEVFEINHSYIETYKIDTLRKTGISNCKKIYGNKQEKLVNNVKQFSPELSEWLILDGYGKIFGRKGLSIKQRELCAVTVLAILLFEDQLYSHINGSIKSGFSINEIKEVFSVLSSTGEKRGANFGVKVLNKYIKNKFI